MTRKTRTLIVRGDLRSQTGWGRATRALVDVMRPNFSAVFGIDLHYSPVRSVMSVPFRIIGDRDIDLLVECGLPLTILNCCLPHEYRYVPSAVNIGYFFWETDKPAIGQGWLEFCAMMNQIWVPTEWQKGVVASWMQNTTGEPDIRIIPWPHQIAATDIQLAHSGPCIKVHRVLTPAELARTEAWQETTEARGRLPWLGSYIVQYAQRSQDRAVLDATASMLDLRASSIPIVFALQTDVPRKGLPVMIAEWLKFRRTSQHATLLLRLSSIDIAKGRSTLHVWLSRLVNRINAEFGASDPGILACYEHLSDGDLTACYQAATAFVTATFGEGFGGPVVESVLAGTLPIVPAHTACASLLPKGYPLSVPTEPVVGRLVDELPLYPASGRWHVPKDGAIAETLAALLSMEHATRATWLDVCTDHLRSILAPDRVSELVREALYDLEAIQ